MFLLGCPDVIVVTDHEPLKGLFGDRDLSKIHNPRLFRLKEKTLRYCFTMQHCPGKWHRGSDAISRNPVVMAHAVLTVFPTKPSSDDIKESGDICAVVRSAARIPTSDFSDNTAAISPDHVRAAGRSDVQYTALIEAINHGFPDSRRATAPMIREYWEVRHRLCVDEGLVLMDRRVVIPVSQRKGVLRCLHSAH